MLRALRDAKIGWNKIGWGLAVAPAKTRERKLGFEFAGSENMNIHVHKSRTASGRSGQRHDVPKSHTSTVVTLRSNVVTFQRVEIPTS